jgi:hypothetical protein
MKGVKSEVVVVVAMEAIDVGTVERERERERERDCVLRCWFEFYGSSVSFFLAQINISL